LFHMIDQSRDTSVRAFRVGLGKKGVTMPVSRRDVLRGGGLAALLGLGVVPLSSCSSSSAGSGTTAGGGIQDMSLWYWDGGLSPAVITAAQTQFASTVKLTATKIGGDFKQKLQTTLAAGAGLPSITGVKGEDMPYFRSAAAKF